MIFVCDSWYIHKFLNTHRNTYSQFRQILQKQIAMTCVFVWLLHIALSIKYSFNL